MARPDIARSFEERDAHISGFQLDVDLGERLGSEERVARFEAVVSTTTGETFTFPSLDIPIRAGDPPARSRTAGYLPSAPPVGRARRVLAFTHSLGLGGAQIYLVELVRRLVRDWSWAVTVVTPRDGALRQDLERAGIAVRVVPSYGESEPQTHEYMVRRFVETGRAGQVDLVLVNTMDAFLGVEVAARLGVPSAWMIHESFSPRLFWKIGFPNTLSDAVRARAERALDQVNLGVFPARATQRLYDDWIDPSRSALLPYGIDLARWDTPPSGRRDAMRARFGLPPTAFVIVSVGTIEPRKGQTRLVLGFRDLMASQPDARLVLVGEHAPQGEFSLALRGFLERNAMQDRVLIRPLGDEVADWYAAADLVVLASDVEALPFCLIEAMASGVCVAAADVFGVPELVRDGEEGFLFQPNDIASLRGTLERVLDMSPTQRRRVAEAGRLRARTMDAGEYARQFVGLVSSIPGWAGDGDRSPSQTIGSRRPDRVHPRKLAFVHLPRTGGTYVDFYLGTRVLGPSGYAIYNSGGWGLDRDWTAEELEEIRSRRDPLAYVHNHAPRWTRETLQRFRGDGWVTFAFVRHPGDQLCSYFFWRRAQLSEGRLDPSLTAQEWEWLGRVSLDEFLSAALSGEMLSAAVAELDPSPWAGGLDFCDHLSDETFGRFLLDYLGHEYRPTQRLNASGSQGFARHLALGDISREVERLLLDHHLYRSYREITDRSPGPDPVARARPADMLRA
ncbi:MAG: glycosyltransferase family 4 protein [Vicinamibacteria bacterium]|nr:glycosyltransferase family 4 protein [Vicinamibacteria bacterium]